jgi:hypothetical protein
MEIMVRTAGNGANEIGLVVRSTPRVAMVRKLLTDSLDKKTSGKVNATTMKIYVLMGTEYHPHHRTERMTMKGAAKAEIRVKTST